MKYRYIHIAAALFFHRMYGGAVCGVVSKNDE